MANSKKPTPKIAAAGTAGAAAIVLVWVAGLFGVDMPEYVAVAIGALAAAGAGYIKSDGGDGRHVANR